MREYMKNIIGNAALKKKLCGDIIRDKLPHALIIEGAHGTGKHTIAFQTAAALACESRNNDNIPLPCTSCPSCKKILGRLCCDIITIGRDGKATLGVDTVRFLKEDVHTLPNDLDFKLYIIEDADKMSEQAQNALLLTLEEPPSFVRFILLCENAELLLQTVRSRAPVLRTEGVTNEELDEYLRAYDTRAAQMKLSAPAEYAELIMASKNGIGTAIDYLNPKTFAPVKEIRRIALDFAEAATDGANAKNTLALLPSLTQKRELFELQLDAISEAITDLLLLKKNEHARLTFFADRERAIEMCDRCSMSFLYKLSEAVLEAINANQRNANVRLTAVEMFAAAGLI